MANLSHSEGLLYHLYTNFLWLSLAPKRLLFVSYKRAAKYSQFFNARTRKQQSVHFNLLHNIVRMQSHVCRFLLLWRIVCIDPGNPGKPCTMLTTYTTLWNLEMLRSTCASALYLQTITMPFNFMDRKCKNFYIVDLHACFYPWFINCWWVAVIVATFSWFWLMHGIAN